MFNSHMWPVATILYNDGLENKVQLMDNTMAPRDWKSRIEVMLAQLCVVPKPHSKLMYIQQVVFLVLKVSFTVLQSFLV